MEFKRVTMGSIVIFSMLYPLINAQMNQMIIPQWVKDVQHSEIESVPDGNCKTMESNIFGSCYTSTECSARGGYAIGICPQHNKVCCLFVLQSTGNKKENTIYLQNKGFPQKRTEPEMIMYFISKTNTNICHFKLEFEEFKLASPKSGNCNQDKFQVIGHNTNSFFPKLCGLNTAQTVYIDVSSTKRPVVLEMALQGSFDRKWNIKLTQIPCDHPMRPPMNCLQYQTSIDGTVKSFNYDQDIIENDNSSIESTGYLNNLRYSICFKRHPNFCDIIFSNPDNDFNIRSSAKLDGDGGNGIEECEEDFLQVANMRLCGGILNPKRQIVDPKNSSIFINPINNEPVVDNTHGPVILEFVSDGTENGKGFFLNYKQMQCPHNSVNKS